MPHRPVRRFVSALILVAGVSLAGCGQAGPSLADPGEILQKSAASLAAAKTVHLRGTVDGQAPLAVGGIAGGTPITLDGTTIDGDIDAAGQALSVDVLLPALLNLRVSLVVVGGYAYFRAPILTGDAWVRQPAAAGVGVDPASLPKGLATFLARPELKPQKLDDARCAGSDCYEVRFTVPAADVRGALGTVGSAIPGLSGGAVGDVTVTAGVRKSDFRLGGLGLDVPAGGAKPLSIRLELTKYDEPVTISAPPADQVKDAPGG